MGTTQKQLLLAVIAFWQLLNFSLSVANSVTLTNNYESCSEDTTASMSLRSWLVADAAVRWMLFYVAMLYVVPFIVTMLLGTTCFSSNSFTAHISATGLPLIFMLSLHFACSWLWAAFGTVLLNRSLCGSGNEIFRNVAASVATHWIGM